MVAIIFGALLDFSMLFSIVAVIASVITQRGKPWPLGQVLFASAIFTAFNVCRNPEVYGGVREVLRLFTD